jgi:hypothetical protein
MTTTPRDDEKSVRLPADHYALLRGIAAAEQRTLRTVIERCLKQYATKHTPQVLKQMEQAA